MNRTRSLLVIFGLIVIASLLSACGTSEEPATPTAAPSSTPEPPTPTAAPTSTPEPSTATPPLTEGQVPTKLSEVPRITAKELKERLDDGEAIVVVDSRTKSEYDTRHIIGAIFKPENYDEYPLDQEIVFYCT